MCELIEKARNTMLHYHGTMLEQARLQEIERKARTAALEVRERLNAEQGATTARIHELEAATAGSLREELRRINEQLNLDERPNDAQFWSDYYRHSTGSLHSTEKSKLKARKQQLEAELPYTPFTPAELELAELRKKSFKPTEDERKKLERISIAVQRQIDITLDSVKQLREQISDLQTELDEVKKYASGYEAETEKVYRTTIAELDKILQM